MAHGRPGRALLRTPSTDAAAALEVVVRCPADEPYARWRPNPTVAKMRALLLSPNLQLALQLAVGALLVSMFTFQRCAACAWVPVPGASEH